MRTVRRLYIYVVTLISLELVVWGLINLLQNIASTAPRASANLLASGLALVLVGLPFFLLHGWVAQREARRDPEEQSARLRALFHYGARLALLAPVVLDLYNLVQEPLRLLFSAPDVSHGFGWVSPVNRLISSAINLAAWTLMERLLRSDWRALPAGEALTEVRRLSRYVWMLFGLVLAAAGVFATLQVLLYPNGFSPLVSTTSTTRLIGGLALILVGVPLWVFCWQIVQRSADLPGERPSTLRRVVFYGLSLLPAVVVLFAAQSALQQVLQALLGDFRSAGDLIQQIYQQIDLMIVFGVLWAYFSPQVQREWAMEPDELARAGLRRLYHYPLAAAGNAATFAGGWLLLGVIVEFLLGVPSVGSGLRFELANGMALLAVGLPFWLANWPRMQAEAVRVDETGDHARRAVLRKIYLYLAVFLTVIGLMSAAGVLFYRLINAALGNPGSNLALECWQQVSLVALLAAWLGYHFAALRADGRLAQRALAERQSAFAVLVLQSDADAFYPALAEALQRQAPNLAVTFHNLAGGLPTLELANAAQAVVLPAALALPPVGGGEATSPSVSNAASLPPALPPSWLAAIAGRRVLVPLAAPGWVWAGQPARSPRDLALETALLLRQLAEGQAPRAAATSNPWLITGYVFGALFAAILALILFSLFASGF